VHTAQVKEVMATKNKTQREKMAREYGLPLMKDGVTPVNHCFRNMQPGVAERVFELLSIEIQHDVFLGPLEEIVCLTLFYFTRDTDHPNYVGLAALNRQMAEYPWRSVAKSDRPEVFLPFPGRLKEKGVARYGEDYGGWMIPNTDHGLKWTAAVAIKFALHMVAMLTPLIKDHSEPM
jgi:hypothetical protein